MALRMWNYYGQFCATLVHQDDLKHRWLLPPAVPIVLYNGEGPWTAAQGMGELVEGLPQAWEEYAPWMHHALVDMWRCPELDRGRRNLADAVFRLHRVETLEGGRDIVRWLKQWLVGAEWTGLRRTLMNWIIKTVLPMRLPGVSVEELGDLRDLDGLEAAMTTWCEKLKAEGRSEGRAEGRGEGRAEGRGDMVRLLVNMARQRFGEAAAGTMATVLGSVRPDAALDDVGTWLVTCDSGDALIAKLRQI